MIIRWLRPQRIYHQIALMVSVVIIALFFTFGWLTARRETQFLQEIMTEDAVKITAMLAESCVRYLLISDYTGLDELLDKFLEMPEGLQIQVCREDGKVVSGVGKESTDSPPVRSFGNTMAPIPEGATAHITFTDDLMIISRPIVATKVIGWVSASFSMNRISQMRRKIWMDTGLAAILWVLFSIVFFMLVFHRFAGAIQRLSDFARRLGSLTGEQIDLRHSSYEVQQLCRSLNWASMDLYSKEQELRSYRDNLEALVARRTEELLDEIAERKKAEEERAEMEVRLRQAQKLEAIGTLAGGIAHDFNNILGPIIGYTEMAMESVRGSSELESDLAQVLKAAYRAKDLVARILAFSRHSRAEERLPLNIGPIVKEALKLIRASIPTSVEITEKIERGLCLADSTQIHQVVVNLCTNAAHAMDDRGMIEVSLSPVDLTELSIKSMSVPHLAPGPYLRLRVSDNGSGMDAGTIPRIFDPYFTTKEVGKGSGLGLAVVHGIVLRHEGGICIRSEPGQGSVFDIYIPRIEEAIEISDDEGVSNIPQGDESILFVDDEPVLAELGARILMQLGYRVTTKTSPLEALEEYRLKPGEFDLLITDYTMPRMTGTELAREVLGIRRDMPVILCTGYSEKGTEAAAGELGIMGFAMKPLSRSQLAKLVRKVLDG